MLWAYKDNDIIILFKQKSIFIKDATFHTQKCEYKKLSFEKLNQRPISHLVPSNPSLHSHLNFWRPLSSEQNFVFMFIFFMMISIIKVLSTKYFITYNLYDTCGILYAICTVFDLHDKFYGFVVNHFLAWTQCTCF